MQGYIVDPGNSLASGTLPERVLRVGAYTSHNGYREGIVIWYVERDTYRAGWYTYVY